MCDLDGVVYLGNRAVPGAGAFLRAAEAAGWQVLLVTNNSARTPATVAEKVERLTGYRPTADQILTSAQAAATLVVGLRCLVLGGEGIVDALTRAGIEQTTDWRSAEGVVVGIAPTLSYQSLQEAVSAVRAGARFVATNLDPTYPTEHGLWPGAGSIVAAVETAAERKAEPAGKPYAPMRDLIRQKLVPGEVVVVGDRPDTDVAMAATEGWKSALVLTGVTTADSDVNPRPDWVVSSIGDLTELL